MNRIHVLNALDFLTIPCRNLLVNADHLHHEINRVLLDLGHDTISRDELRDLLQDDLDYRDVLEADGRVVWRGIGLRNEPPRIERDVDQIILREDRPVDPLRYVSCVGRTL
jgi:hypothetical protein